VRTNSDVHKRDEQTDKQTDRQKTQRFWPPRRRVKSEHKQTWHGDKGPRARSCTSKTFRCQTHSNVSALQGENPQNRPLSNLNTGKTRTIEHRILYALFPQHFSVRKCQHNVAVFHFGTLSMACTRMARPTRVRIMQRLAYYLK